MAFLYKLTYSSRSRYIEPKAIGSVVVAREEGEVFFREKLNGSIEVTGDDFHFLDDAKKFAVECCQEISLYIERSCTGGTELFWQGYFTLMDIEWDLDNTQATIKKVQVRDDYTAIFSNWHKKINWLDYAKIYRPGSGKSSFGETIHFHQITPTTERYNPGGSDQYWRGFSFNNGILFLFKEALKGSGHEDQADITLTQLSQFFTSDINPVTDKYNYLKDVILTQLSDAKRPGASTAAIIGIVTLKEVLSELKAMFNAYWFINEQGKIQIEHISYFPHYSYEPAEITIDLTDPEYSETMEGRNKYSYQTEQLRGIEGVAWAMNAAGFDAESIIYAGPTNPSNVEFSGAFMNYSDSCVPKDDKGEKTDDIKTVNLFVTDWGGLLNKPDSFPEQGWVLAHVTNYLTTTGVEFGWTPLSGQRVINGCLSATRLYFDFGRYDASFQYGMFSPYKEIPKELDEEPESILEKPTRTKSVKRIKTMTAVELGLCCGLNFDFSGLVKHPLANPCVVSQIEYDLQVDSVQMTLQAESLCSDVPFPDYEEVDEPAEGCKPAGMLIRSEFTDKYRTENAAYIIITSVYTDYYADGACGEYTNIREEAKTTPRRRIGPR